MKTCDTKKIKETIFKKVYNEIVNIQNRKDAVRYRIDQPVQQLEDFLEEVSIGKSSVVTKTSPTKSNRMYSPS